MLRAIGILSLAIGLVLGLTLPAQAAGGAYALGDSVMLGARSQLASLGFTVDAKVSRQATSGPAILRKLGRKLPTDVILHFGTNGTYPLKTCKDMVNIAGPERRVYLVTVKVPRSWESVNNRMLRKCAASFAPGRVNVVDWNWASSRRSTWLYADGYHLRPDGAKNFARIMNEAIDKGRSR
jgi:hypothetical protein